MHAPVRNGRGARVGSRIDQRRKLTGSCPSAPVSPLPSGNSPVRRSQHSGCCSGLQTSAPSITNIGRPCTRSLQLPLRHPTRYHCRMSANSPQVGSQTSDPCTRSLQLKTSYPEIVSSPTADVCRSLQLAPFNANMLPQDSTVTLRSSGTVGKVLSAEVSHEMDEFMRSKTGVVRRRHQRDPVEYIVGPDVQLFAARISLP
jgi:hypothetical protein